MSQHSAEETIYYNVGCVGRWGDFGNFAALCRLAVPYQRIVPALEGFDVSQKVASATVGIDTEFQHRKRLLSAQNRKTQSFGQKIRFSHLVRRHILTESYDLTTNGARGKLVFHLKMEKRRRK